MKSIRFTHFQMFCGFGGLAAGIDDAEDSLYGLHGSWECIGAVDSNADAVERFNRYCQHPVAHLLDLFNEDQYRRYHGHEPPAGWQEVTPADLRAIAGGRAPSMIGSSPPCRGYSGLISQSKSKTDKYQALNELAFRGFWLALEAWQNDPPALWVLENVPGIATRGGHFIEQIRALFRPYGYSITGESHCLGEIGGLSQRRKRYMLVARHTEKLPALLYRPRSRSLQTVGQVLAHLPLPGDPRGGVLHAPRRVSFRTAVRLALIKPGRDWRWLKTYNVNDAGNLADFVLVPERYGYHGALGVIPWNDTCGAVTGRSTPTTGSFAVEDPRPGWKGEYGQLGVTEWDETAHTVTTARSPAQGRFSIGDPRAKGWGGRGKYRVTQPHEPAGAVLANPGTGSGAYAIADPKPGGTRMNNVFRVVAIDGPSPAVTTGNGPSAGGLAVADPVDAWMAKRDGGAWTSGGQYGVVPWSEPAGAVTANASADSGRFSVADARLPDPNQVDVWVIVSAWGSWNRPFTDLELAALQSLVRPEDIEAFNDVFEGASSTTVRKHIGNAVPRAAAREIGKVFLKCLLAAEAGETFTLDSEPAWARSRQIAVMCSLDLGGSS